MELGMSLCRTIKRQKSMSFLGPKIWNKISSNIKTAGTTSFMHHLKKEILSKRAKNFQMTKNFIHHAQYLQNHTSYDCHLW